jgi:HlyD family secretion protein
MASKEIFRKVSLERLSSPEKLDMLTQITTSTGWLALSALGLLLIMAILWGLAGSIPVTVKGEGMLVNRGGVTNVVALGSGQITDIFVRTNDQVTVGQVIAHISQPQAVTDATNSKNELAELKGQHQKLTQFARKDLDLQLTGLIAQKDSILHSISSLEKKSEFYRSQLEKQLTLKEKGLIVPAKVESTRQELANITEQIESLKVRLADLQTQENLSRNKAADAVQQSLNRIKNLERAVGAMLGKVTTESNVVSTIAGKVVEIKAAKGAVVAAGTPIISIEQGEKRIEAIIYVSESEGKKIREGMTLDIQPSSVRKEEFGSMVGTVTSVSEYPTSAVGILAVLGNEQLVQRLSKNGAPYTVSVRLEPDSNSQNGFKWSSGKGPATPIVSGTLCQAEIVVEKKRPLEMVIPYLKRSVGN